MGLGRSEALARIPAPAHPVSLLVLMVLTLFFIVAIFLVGAVRRFKQPP
jgi:hypothetical protein